MSKTKIVHIVNSLCVGGIERMAISVCNDLDKDFFDVTLLVLSNNDNVLKTHLSPEVHLIEVESNIELYRLKEVLRLFSLSRKIGSIIDKIRPDIIHTHTYFYTATPLFNVIHHRLSFARHFHTIHTSGLHYALPKANLKVRFEQSWLKRNSTIVICVSKDVQRRVKHLMPSIATHFIPNYVSFKATAQIEQRVTIDYSQVIRVAYLARLAEGKNHRRLLEAFAVVVENFPKAVLRLIGDGELKEELEQKVKNLNIENNVEFCGHSNQIESLLQQCDLGVFPSEYEGFGMALVEMASVGLPICCSDISHFRDLRNEGGDMLYFDPYDFQDIAKKIMAVISDPDLRKQLYTASCDIASSYTKEKIIPLYQQLYEASRQKI